MAISLRTRSRVERVETQFNLANSLLQRKTQGTFLQNAVAPACLLGFMKTGRDKQGIQEISTQGPRYLSLAVKLSVVSTSEQGIGRENLVHTIGADKGEAGRQRVVS